MAGPEDARKLSPGTTLRPDVAVIGAGAAGITLALELAGSGLRVCLLESGGMGATLETQALYRGENAGRPYFPLDGCRLRFFGGTTNHWAGVCHPLDPFDLEARDWVPHSGWPLRFEEIARHYPRAAELCELGRGTERVGEPRDPGAPDVLPWPSERIRTTALGFSPPTRFGEAYRQELEAAENVRILLHANAVELEPERDAARLRRVRFATLEGGRFDVEARAYVLAAGGIENARLLLASRSVRPAGLGNENDLVGRFFMEHPHYDEAATWLLADPALHRRFYDWPDPAGGYDGATMGVMSFTPEVLRRERMLGFSAELRISSPAQETAAFESLRTIVRSARRGHLPDDLSGHVWNVLGDLESAAQGAWQRYQGSVGEDAQYRVIVRSEQAPNPESRVTLDEEARDALGMPRSRLAWRLQEADRASLRRGLELLAREVGRQGWGRVRIPDPAEEPGWGEALEGGWHHMGTTRMAEDPRRGVVDGRGRLHAARNLYVAGSSVFPTCGWANPTLTIVALAVRMAEDLRAELGGGGGPA